MKFALFFILFFSLHCFAESSAKVQPGHSVSKSKTKNRKRNPNAENGKPSFVKWVIEGGITSKSSPPKPVPENKLVSGYEKRLNSLAPLVMKAGGLQKKGKYTTDGHWRSWTVVQADNLPAQGWKLFISAQPGQAENLIKILIPELQQRKIPHRVNDNISEFMNLSDSQKGKLFILSPSSPEEAKNFAEGIDRLLYKKGYRPENFVAIEGAKAVGHAGGVFVRYGELQGKNSSIGGVGGAPFGMLVKLDADGKAVLGIEGQPIYVQEKSEQFAPDWIPMVFEAR